jgi:hypothetical protein
MACGIPHLHITLSLSINPLHEKKQVFKRFFGLLFVCGGFGFWFLMTGIFNPKGIAQPVCLNV